KAGNATDVVLAPASLNSNGNETQLYVAFAGAAGTGGVYTAVGSADTATALMPLFGGAISTPRVGYASTSEIPTGAPPATPNSISSSRIELATPALSNNPLADTFYQGWLYAAVVDPTGNFLAMFMTKDFGLNWTQLNLPATGGFATNNELATIPQTTGLQW